MKLQTPHAGCPLRRAAPDRIGRSCLLLLVAALLATIIFQGCEQKLFRDDLEAIQARGKLRVITRNNGTCYYEGPHRPEGFEYDLVKAFADHLGLELELIIIDSEPDMVTELPPRQPATHLD